MDFYLLEYAVSLKTWVSVDCLKSNEIWGCSNSLAVSYISDLGFR